MILKYDEYVTLLKKLRNVRDLSKFRYPRGMLHSILQQKKVESVKRKYHNFASRIEEIVEHWEKTRSFPRWLTLTPVMKVRLLLKGLGFSAKSINKMLREPERAEDEDLERIIRDAVTKDFVYSPIAAKLQRSRGKLGERILEIVLDEYGLEFKTEKELRGIFPKTPDFYFENCAEINGREVRWIESKALFGDPYTHSLFERKQYAKYTEMFGNGMVVYWMGYVEGIEASDGSEFRCELKRALYDMRVFLGGCERSAEKLEGVFVDVADEDPIKAAEKIVDAYAEGRVVTGCDSREVGRILRNMGFDVVYLK